MGGQKSQTRKPCYPCEDVGWYEETDTTDDNDNRSLETHILNMIFKKWSNNSKVKMVSHICGRFKIIWVTIEQRQEDERNKLGAARIKIAQAYTEVEKYHRLLYSPELEMAIMEASGRIWGIIWRESNCCKWEDRDQQSLLWERHFLSPVWNSNIIRRNLGEVEKDQRNLNPGSNTECDKVRTGKE